MCKAPSSGLGAAPATCGPSQLEGENVVDACRLPKAEALPSLPSGSQLLCCLCSVPSARHLGEAGAQHQSSLCTELLLDFCCFGPCAVFGFVRVLLQL